MKKKRVSSIIMVFMLLVSSLSSLNVRAVENVKSLLEEKKQQEHKEANDTYVSISEELQNTTLPVNSTAKDVAYALLQSYLKQYNLTGDTKNNFKDIEITNDSLTDGSVVKLQQFYKELPIIGAVQKILVTKKNPPYFSGSIFSSVEQKIVNESATYMDVASVSKIALKSLDNEYENKATEVKKVVYPFEGKAYIAYEVNVYEKESKNKSPLWYVYVDAKDGAIIHKYSNIKFDSYANGEGKGVLGDKKVFKNLQKDDKTFYLVDDKSLNDNPADDNKERNIYMYNANNTKTFNTLWKDADNKYYESQDAPAVDAYYYLQQTYDYYLDKQGRQGFDNHNSIIKSAVHVGNAYNNAYFDGDGFFFGDGDGKMFRPLSGGVDVVAHEYTHAVTQYTAGLKYEYESGAMNEAISDVFGSLVEDYYSQKNKKTPGNWLIGEDVYTPDKPGDALRSMADPTINGDPDHYSKLKIGDQDNGYVHSNSGIINKAAYLIGNGGTHYGYKVNAIGKEKLGKIFYRALTTYLVESSNMYNLRGASIQSAIDLYGEKSPEVQTVKTAFDAVGIYGVNSKTNVKLGDKLNLQFTKPNETQWLTVDAKDIDKMKYSHAVFQSSYDAGSVKFTMYTNKKNADLGEAYPDYKDKESELSFPVSWNDIYYIKVTATLPTKVALTTSGKYEQPATEPECITEVASKEETSIGSLLSNLRVFRNDVLNTTDFGKELKDIYYEVSMGIVKDYVVDSSFRTQINTFFKENHELLASLKDAKTVNGYTLTKKDVTNITMLKQAINKKVSDETRKKIDAVWGQLNIENAVGKTVGQLLLEDKLMTSNVTSEDQEYLVKLNANVTGESFIQSFGNQVNVSKNDFEFVPVEKGPVKLENWYKLKIQKII